MTPSVIRRTARRGTPALALFAVLASPSFALESRQLAELSLEELGHIEITSVSKRAEPLLDAPASVYVITRDDILRSGVTSLPEALRLAPGVEVARRSAHAWSITIRGFNHDNLATKLLVLIDGRSVYSPLYAGVFWDVQDTLLEDVERIEVVAGPGGTLWGANAVNGVINVITRSARDTTGTFVELGGGNEEQGFGGLRYGTDIGDSAAIRAYARYFDRDSSRRAGGAAAPDEWRMARAGFRMDWQSSSSDQWRFQGDIYDGEKAAEALAEYTLGTLPDGIIRSDVELSGGNLMAEWHRDTGSGSDTRLQVYYDRTHRDIPNTYAADRDTFDVDFQQGFMLGERNALLWGAGFRLTSDELGNTTFATFEPDSRTDRTWSLFVQDKIGLLPDRLFLTLGSKFEENDYTGFEWQPNARLSWRIDDERTAWLAVSRAVRIPSRLDADLRLTVPLAVPDIPFPVYVTVDGSDDFESEELIAWEAGYRWQATDTLTMDVATFYNDYDELQTQEPADPVLVIPSYILLPNALTNNLHGESYGGTAAFNWQPLEHWRLRLHYSYLEANLRSDPGSLDANAPLIAGNSPRHQASLFSFVDLFETLHLYTAVRHVDELPNRGVDAYTALDLSLRWNVTDDVVVSVTGQNVADPRRDEFGSGIEHERSIFVSLSATL